MSLETTCAALADPARRGVVDLLRRRPRRASDLAEALGTSRPAMSRHLKVLRTSGLVEPVSHEADMRARMYQLRPDSFRQLRNWLAEVERFWTLELDAFKRHAERTRSKPR